MMHPRLQEQLRRLDQSLRAAALWRRLAVAWGVFAVVGLVMLAARVMAGVNSTWLWWGLCGAGLTAAVIAWIRHAGKAADLNRVIALMEQRHPELRYLLSAAAEQQPDPESGRFHFLQDRVIQEIVRHPERWKWQRELHWKEKSAKRYHALAFVAAAVVAFFGLRTGSHSQPTSARIFLDEIEVAPGDTEIERGTGIVITARFGKQPPAEATLVITGAGGESRRIPLERNLADPIFGTSIPQVSEDTLYRVEYDGKETREFKIAVFEFPALQRADALLEFPQYTGLTNKTIPDTRRISAVEGSALTYTLELNKPVARARLVGKNETLALDIATNAVAMLNHWILTNSGRYALELVDFEGRTNKIAADFSLQVLTNRRPDLKIAFPRGDQRVSPLQELQLQVEAVDDFGLLKSGIGFGVAGEDPKFIEFTNNAGPNEKRQFEHLISLEQLGVQPDQVVAYFAWADDYGPDGNERRQYSDIFFAEVRPFEEIFRRDQSGAAESQSQQQQQQERQGQGGANDSSQLAEMQKNIVIATWKLQQHGGAITKPMP